MCLQVTKLIRRTVMKCNKILKEDRYTCELVTKYIDTIVPTNGWLLPERKSSIKIKHDTNVHGGFIHAYTSTKKTRTTFSSCYYKRLMCIAYAIKVEAIGSNKDLICRAMYIPYADKTANKGSTIAFLSKPRTTKEIIKKFPFLKEIV